MYYSLLLTILSGIVAAAPLNSRSIQAGGPAIVPIPSSCTLSTVTPEDASISFTTTTTFTTANNVYTMYIPANSSQNKTASQKTCLEQCYGFGSPGQCVAALWAENVTYTAYGVTSEGVACAFFGEVIAGTDLVGVEDGQWSEAKATNIECPTPRSP